MAVTIWVSRDRISTKPNPYELMCFFLFDVSSLATQTVLPAGFWWGEHEVLHTFIVNKLDIKSTLEK